MFAAVLDSCVLWPSLQRDFLLSLAVEGIYRPLWSERILEEVHYTEEAKFVRRGAASDDARKAADHLITQMREAFDDSCVSGWKPLEGTYGLPDPDDEHVVAAAHMGGAGAIVTHNLRDFPPDRLPGELDVQTPAVFAAHTVGVDPVAAGRAVSAIAARSGSHGRAYSNQQILDLLDARYGLNQSTEQIRALVERD